MFYSAKYILFESFNAPMMENTAQFKNKVNEVSLLKVGSFLTKATSYQIAAFQVNGIVDKQKTTNVHLIPAQAVCSNNIHGFSNFHWKPPEYIKWFGQEFDQQVLETDILLQSMKCSRFSSTGCIDNMRFMIITSQYLLNIRDACAFICAQLEFLRQLSNNQFVIPFMFLDMIGKYQVMTLDKLVPHVLQHLDFSLYFWKNIKDRTGPDNGFQEILILNLCYQYMQYLWSYTQMYKKPFVFTDLSATQSIFVPMGKLTKYAEGRFVYEGYVFLEKNILYTQNRHFGNFYFQYMLYTENEEGRLSNPFLFQPLCGQIPPTEGKITGAAVSTIALAKNTFDTLNRYIGNFYCLQIVLNVKYMTTNCLHFHALFVSVPPTEDYLVKAPVHTAMGKQMCMDSCPLTNISVYGNAFPARFVLRSVESYTGNTSVMTLGLTEQECYHLKKDFNYQNEANFFMPMTADTDNLPVQTYSFAERTILDKAFQDCVPINRNGFEMLPVDMHLIERVLFQCILHCMQYAIHYLQTQLKKAMFACIVPLVISRNENSASWFLKQPHTQCEEKGF